MFIRHGVWFRQGTDASIQNEVQRTLGILHKGKRYEFIISSMTECHTSIKHTVQFGQGSDASTRHEVQKTTGYTV